MTTHKITVGDDGYGHWAYEFVVDGRRFDSVGQRLYSERAARRAAERHLTAIVQQRTYSYDFTVPVTPPTTYEYEVADAAG